MCLLIIKPRELNTIMNSRGKKTHDESCVLGISHRQLKGNFNIVKWTHFPD